MARALLDSLAAADIAARLAAHVEERTGHPVRTSVRRHLVDAAEVAVRSTYRGYRKAAMAAAGRRFYEDTVSRGGAHGVGVSWARVCEEPPEWEGLTEAQRQHYISRATAPVLAYLHALCGFIESDRAAVLTASGEAPTDEDAA